MQGNMGRYVVSFLKICSLLIGIDKSQRTLANLLLCVTSRGSSQKTQLVHAQPQDRTIRLNMCLTSCLTAFRHTWNVCTFVYIFHNKIQSCFCAHSLSPFWFLHIFSDQKLERLCLCLFKPPDFIDKKKCDFTMQELLVQRCLDLLVSLFLCDFGV